MSPVRNQSERMRLVQPGTVKAPVAQAASSSTEKSAENPLKARPTMTLSLSGRSEKRITTAVASFSRRKRS
jgi:hypothetical protein